MSSDSRNERERLKEEYKVHYRKMREVKDQLKRTIYTRNIEQALNNMSASELMASFEDFVFQLKSRVAKVEARLDATMENLDSGEKAHSDGNPYKDGRSTRARETLRQLKLEMGQLYSEIEKKADAIQTEKTVGNPPDQDEHNRDKNR